MTRVKFLSIKNIAKAVLFKSGYQERKIKGGALKGAHFFLNLRTDTQQWRGIYEQPLQSWLKKYVKEGDTCLDIGAAEGYFTLLMAKLAGSRGTVHAFEPSLLHRWIPENFNLNSDIPLSCLKVHNTFVKGTKPCNDREVTIDELVLKRQITQVNVIKIDAEGEEVNILQGMAETLNHFHPHLFIEIHSRNLLAQVELITKKFNYVMRLQIPEAREKRPLEFNAFFFSDAD